MNLLRLFIQTFVLALEQLWANRFRAMLTTLGIVIGVASVIAIVGATDGLRKTVLKTFEEVGASRFVIFPRFPREAPGRFSRQQIVLKKAEAFGLMNYTPSVARLTPIKGFAAQVQYGDRLEQNVQVQGVLPHWNIIEGRSITSGRPFMTIDEEERRAVCLINDRGVQELNLPADPSGESILISGRRFLIVGVVETKTLPAMFGGGEPLTEVFIPFATADAWKPEPVFSIFIQGQTKSPELYPEAQAEIRAYLRKSRGLGPGDPDTFRVQAVEQFIEQIERVAFTLTLAAVGIVAISLVVGGVGIMNIMLASVSERTREIGLRKAVGAQPAVILMQFLVEAVVLCLVGAALGLAVGFGLAYGIAAIPNSPLADLVVPAWAVILSVSFSAATGVIFGMFPAIKAARLDPIEALRHE